MEVVAAFPELEFLRYGVIAAEDDAAETEGLMSRCFCYSLVLEAGCFYTNEGWIYWY